MTKVDYLIGVLCLFSFLAGFAWRMWCHSHFRAKHPVEADLIEKSDERFLNLWLDYPLSEFRRDSMTSFLYRTCWRGGICRDCIWASWIIVTADVVLVATAVILLMRVNWSN